MSSWRALVIGSCLACALASFASMARADAIGGPCPSGQIYQTNPTQPGAMHHGGGQCVPDPSASHCSASPSAAHVWPLAIAGLTLVLVTVVARHRDKVRAR